MSVKQILLVTLSLMLLAGTAPAQETDSRTKQASQSSSLAVTAAVSASDTIRVASPASVLATKLEIYTTAGVLVFDSGLRQGNVIDWKVADSPAVTDGSYLLVTTTKDLQGNYSQKLGNLSLQSGQLVLKAQRHDGLNATQTDALKKSSLSQKIDDAGTDDALTILRDGKERSLVISAHDGRDGQVTSTSGALTLRTGDILTGKEKEQMRITPEGNVGIGTDKPEAALDVAGEIRARGGIRFSDGSVLTSAANATRADSRTTVVGTNANAPNAGTGTQNKIARWADNVGTLGDSSITETVDGFVGIGTTTPTNKFVVEGAVPSLLGTMSVIRTTGSHNGFGLLLDATGVGNNNLGFAVSGVRKGSFAWDNSRNFIGMVNYNYSPTDFSVRLNGDGSFTFNDGATSAERFRITAAGNVGIGVVAPTQKLDIAGNLRISGAGNGIIFADGSTMNSASGAAAPSGTSIVNAINDAATVGTIGDNRLSLNLARLNGANAWSGANVFNGGLSANNAAITNVGNPTNAGDAVNKSFFDTNAIRLLPGAPQVSVGDANGTATMVNLRGGSTCCGGPGGFTAADFKVFQNGSFIATGNLGIGVSPMEGKGYRTSWYTYKGAFRSGYADNEWDDANTGFFSWAGGSNSTASGLYAFAFGDTNFASSTSSIAFGSGNEVKGAAGFSAGAGNRVCDTYGVAFGNKAQSGGPLINGKCDPDSFNLTGLAAIAMGYNVTADKDHTTAMGKFASNNGFSGTFIWSDGSATASADTFRNTANNEFAARATGGFRFRTNLTGTTGCNLPAGSGVFNCTSSRATKENFIIVSGEDVLSRLRTIPVSTWNYISEGNETRHMGPMAEDFYQGFKLGTGNTSIGVQDLTGVSLAAIKTLDQRTIELQHKTAEVAQLQLQVEELRSANNAMEKRLTALEQNMQTAAAPRQHMTRRARR